MWPFMRPRIWEADWGNTVSPELGAQESLPHSLNFLFFLFFFNTVITIRLAAPTYELLSLVLGAVHYTLHKLHGFMSPAWSPLTQGFANPGQDFHSQSLFGVVSENLQINTHLKGSLKSRFFFFLKWLFFL